MRHISRRAFLRLAAGAALPATLLRWPVDANQEPQQARRFRTWGQEDLTFNELGFRYADAADAQVYLPFAWRR